MATHHCVCFWPMDLSDIQSPYLHTACWLKLSFGAEGPTHITNVTLIPRYYRTVCHVFDKFLHCAVVTSILLRHLMEIYATGNNVVFFCQSALIICIMVGFCMLSLKNALLVICFRLILEKRVILQQHTWKLIGHWTPLIKHVFPEKT
jgi:hypothetical protein